MSRGTMLYIRVSQGIMEDLMKVTHNRQLLQDKSALTIICETLLEWAAAQAAHGEEAEKLIEKRQCLKEWRAFQRKKKGYGEDSAERILQDAQATKDAVLDNLAEQIRLRRAKLEMGSVYGKLMREE